jgi:hypothetical protein
MVDADMADQHGKARLRKPFQAPKLTHYGKLEQVTMSSGDTDRSDAGSIDGFGSLSSGDYGDYFGTPSGT